VSTPHPSLNASALDTSASGAFPREFLECLADSGLITWYRPDCSAPQMWFAGTMLGALGYGPDELHADVETYDALRHPEDRKALEGSIRTIIAERRVGDYEFEYRLRCKDGTYRWVRAIASVVVGRSGRLCAFSVARIIDVDKQRESAAQRLTEDALHTVLDEIGHPVVLMTPDGRVVHANEATARVVGRGAAGACAVHYCAFLHKEDGSPNSDDLREVVLTGRRKERQLWRFNRWWQLYLVPLLTHENEVRQVLLLAHDITAIKNEQAAQLAREKALTNTLVREIHHRIKNHLQGLVGLLRSYSRPQVSARELTDTAVAHILSIATVHGLLANEGRSSIEFAELVRKIVDTLRIGATIPVYFKLDSAQWQPTELAQEEAVPLAVAIGELFTNAVKHTADRLGARVEGRLRHVDGVIELNLSNSPARLPEGFRASGVGGPHSGLALVHALLPRDRSQLEILQEGEQVTTRLRLMPKPRSEACLSAHPGDANHAQPGSDGAT